MVFCLEQGADLHTAQLMPLPLTVSCFSKIQIGFTLLVPAHPGSPGKGPLNAHARARVCVLHTSAYTGRLSVAQLASSAEIGVPMARHSCHMHCPSRAGKSRCLVF